MNAISPLLIVLGILAAIVLGAIIYFKIKPYIIRHDTTITVNGGLGSGKTLTCVKLVRDLLKKNRFFKWKMHNFWQVKVFNKCRALLNKSICKKHPLKMAEKRKKPRIYCNMPMCIQSGLFGRKKEWADQLTMEHLLLHKEIIEYSIVYIDEFPQFVDQYMWDEELVQKNLNEFITFFRHYIGGFCVISCQSLQEIECHFRRKLNQSIQLFNFKKHLFGLFYTVRMCDVMINDSMMTMTNTYIEENTKLHFGLFPRKGTYDTRCYKPRYKNILLPTQPHVLWPAITTTQILRIREYISPLDDETTREQKEEMLRECKILTRKENRENEKRRKTRP